MPKLTQQQKDAVRADILKTARAVFSEKGYEATAMKDIVERSGRSFGGVYLYYANKEDLFLDLLRRQYEDMAEDFMTEKTENVWVAFESFLRDQEQRVKEAGEGLAPCMYEYFIVGRRQAERRQLNEERRRAVYSSILSLVEHGIMQGELHPSQPPNVFTHWLISFLDGIFLESIITGAEAIELSKQFDMLKDVCKSILLPTGLEESK